jgi:glycosyltransferase involved in cell wall biosynthesis
MITISLCMIVKNEEDVLKRCVDSVKDIVDEIIIVDTGSTDKTREIARSLTDKVYDFEWIDDFSAARNFAYSKATMEYILILDADDVVLEEDREKFKKLKRELSPDVDMVLMPYNVGFDSKGNVTLTYNRERLSRRDRGFRWVEPVHEHLAYFGKTQYADVCITHRKTRPSEPGRNLRIYEKTMAEGRPLSPRGQYYYARELYYHKRFEEAVKQFEAFLDGGKGWVEDNIRACQMLGKCKGALNDPEGMLRTYLRSFVYDVPRPDLCCNIGNHFKQQGDYTKAKFWYLTALNYQKPAQSLGFQHPEYYGYIPAIELCVCCDKLGETEEAIRYNRMAGEFKPGDPAVKYNEEYFEKKKAQEKPNPSA